MEIKRKVEIFVATNEKFVVRQTTGRRITVCEKCGEPMLTAEQTAGMFGITQRRIFQIIETGAAHFTESKAGAFMVCLTSLAAVSDWES